MFEKFASIDGDKTGSHSARLERAEKQISFRILHVQRIVCTDCLLAAAQ